MIVVEEVSKEYGEADGWVLRSVSFEVPDGCTLSIIGPSGSGKTTLLYMMAGLLEPTKGRIRITPSAHSHRNGSGKPAIVFQDFGLFPWKTVFDNIVLGMHMAGACQRKAAETARRLMNELGIGELGGRYPVQLSGGQKQRVAIARALALQPEVLLLDEPFSSLDAITREHLQNLVKDLWRMHRLSYVLVTHSVEEAVFMGQTVLVLQGKPGMIAHRIDNPLFDTPDFRLHPAFFETVRMVRRALTELPENGADVGKRR
ncbi:MAG: ABC transporter ATP-binding protein [Thermodesulfobacteriota bacterium]